METFKLRTVIVLVLCTLTNGELLSKDDTTRFQVFEDTPLTYPSIHVDGGKNQAYSSSTFSKPDNSKTNSDSPKGSVTERQPNNSGTDIGLEEGKSLSKLGSSSSNIDLEAGEYFNDEEPAERTFLRMVGLGFEISPYAQTEDIAINSKEIEDDQKPVKNDLNIEEVIPVTKGKLNENEHLTTITEPIQTVTIESTTTQDFNNEYSKTNNENDKANHSNTPEFIGNTLSQESSTSVQTDAIEDNGTSNNPLEVTNSPIIGEPEREILSTQPTTTQNSNSETRNDTTISEQAQGSTPSATENELNFKGTDSNTITKDVTEEVQNNSLASGGFTDSQIIEDSTSGNNHVDTEASAVKNHATIDNSVKDAAVKQPESSESTLEISPVTENEANSENQPNASSEQTLNNNEPPAENIVSENSGDLVETNPSPATTEGPIPKTPRSMSSSLQNENEIIKSPAEVIETTSRRDITQHEPLKIEATTPITDGTDEIDSIDENLRSGTSQSSNKEALKADGESLTTENAQNFVTVTDIRDGNSLNLNQKPVGKRSSTDNSSVGGNDNEKPPAEKIVVSTEKAESPSNERESSLTTADPSSELNSSNDENLSSAIDKSPNKHNSLENDRQVLVDEDKSSTTENLQNLPTTAAVTEGDSLNLNQKPVENGSSAVSSSEVKDNTSSIVETIPNAQGGNDNEKPPAEKIVVSTTEANSPETTLKPNKGSNEEHPGANVDGENSTSETNNKSEGNSTKPSTGTTNVKADPTEIDAKPTCTSPGRYAHKTDCRKYYICSMNASALRLLELICPPRFAYSERMGKCTRDVSSCGDPKCTTAGKIADQNSPNLYFWCVKSTLGGYRKYHVQCSKGSTFNTTLQNCVSDVNNNESLADSNDSDEAKDVDFKFVKEEEKRRKKEEKLIKQEQKKREKEEKKKLKEEKKLEKLEKKLKEKTCKQTEGCFTSEEKEFECQQEGNFPDPNNIRKYYLCSKRVIEVLEKNHLECPENHVFNPDRKICAETEDDSR